MAIFFTSEKLCVTRRASSGPRPGRGIGSSSPPASCSRTSRRGNPSEPCAPPGSGRGTSRATARTSGTAPASRSARSRSSGTRKAASSRTGSWTSSPPRAATATPTSSVTGSTCSARSTCRPGPVQTLRRARNPMPSSSPPLPTRDQRRRSPICWLLPSPKRIRPAVVPTPLVVQPPSTRPAAPEHQNWSPPHQSIQAAPCSPPVTARDPFCTEFPAAAAQDDDDLDFEFAKSLEGTLEQAAEGEVAAEAQDDDTDWFEISEALNQQMHEQIDAFDAAIGRRGNPMMCA
ncbi:hypothetical protein PR202_gb08320 [Eleusine coracana subsp. coracana]|uniref:Uncharacterized protein n=1 Tax=Eleusine coracana subsp. coracana TaxID=191504 RepID=A0AAV5EEB1_ELECO|nr:hypothetical protein PR202_gb08320 [Eleusine coracana subsp. coracana]